MNRRELFGFLAGGAVAATGLWEPTKKIFLPPRGGWITASDVLKEKQLIGDMVHAIWENAAKQFEKAYVDSLMYGVGRMEIGGRTIEIAPPPPIRHIGPSVVDILKLS